MAEKSPQDLAHHARFDPPFHFFVLPVFVISWVVSMAVLVRHPCFYSAWGVVLAMAALWP
jgi:hypothetical protein